MMRFISLCMLAFVFQDVKGQCSEAPKPGEASPFPDIFSITNLGYQLTVEANDVNKKRTIYATEYYDKENVRGRVDIMVSGQKMGFLYLGESDETFSTPRLYTCNSKKLSDSTLKPPYEEYGMYGWTNKDNYVSVDSDKALPILGPSNLLRDGYAAFKAGKMGKETDRTATVRGIKVDVYKQCLKDGTEIRYFFIDKDTESGFGVKGQPVPARITVKNKDVDHSYDIVNYQTYASHQEEVFAIPVTVGCQRLVPDLKTMPVYDKKDFHVEAEVIYTPFLGQDTHSYVSNLELTIDSTSSHLAYVVTPWKTHSDAQLAQPGDLTEEVFDFANDILYDLDKATDTCKITQISKSKTPTARITFPDNQTLDLMNEDLILSSEKTVKEFHYLGEGIERGLPVSIYERVIDYPELMGQILITRYHLSDDAFLNSEHMEKNAPVKVVYWDLKDVGSKTEFTGVAVFNFYSFSSSFQDKPKKFDVTPCFNKDDQSKWFQISFPMNGVEPSDIIPEIPFIRDNILGLLRSGTMKFSPLRIPKIMVDVDSDNIYVTGLLLERPDFKFDFELVGGYEITVAGGARDRGLMTGSSCEKICLEDPKCKYFSLCGAICKTSEKDPIAEKDGVSPPRIECGLFQNLKTPEESLPTMDEITAYLALDVDLEILKIELPIYKDGKLTPVTFTAKEFKDGIAYGLEGLTRKREDQIESQFSIYKTGFRLDEKATEVNKPFGAQSFETCRRLCLNSAECESISFCMANSQCALSAKHTEEISQDHMVADSQCIILSRAYIDYFERYEGLKLVQSAADIKDADSAENCAKKCMTEKGYDCQSFDFCYQEEKGQCMLHKDHFLNMNEDKHIDKAVKCGHYSRKMVYDFDRKPGNEMTGEIGAATASVSAEQCAKQCLETPSGCSAFEYCQDITKGSSTCRTTNLPAAKRGLNVKATCNVYEYSEKAGRVKRQVKEEDEGYSRSTVGGVSFFLFLVGAAIGVGAMFGFGYYRANRQ